MDQTFLKIVNNAFAAGWMILAVILLRMLLKKSPKQISCLLWGLVAARLIIPFHMESALSLIPSADTVPADIAYSAVPEISTGIQSADSIVNPVIEKHFKPNPAASANPLQIWIPVCSAIWIAGAACMLIYALASFLLLKKKVSASLEVSDKIYVCDDLQSPFILGILHPEIFLPSGIDACTAEYVLAHERAHLKRRDHIWKPLGFFILAVYWFHPLCWAAFILFCRDIEYACDEKATKGMDKNHRADYCQALLSCSTKKRRITACPVAFGEARVKERIQSVLHYKKPAFWMVASSLAACVLAAVFFMTDPKTEGQTSWAGTEPEKQMLTDTERKTLTDTGQEAQTAQAGTSQEAQAEHFSAQNNRTAGTPQDGQKESDTKAGNGHAATGRQKAEALVAYADSMLREGYQEVSIIYADNAETGWDYSSENPWETEELRDLLAQAALKELYTLTGYQLKECVYTTDGRSNFIFGKSAEAIRRSTAFYSRDYGWMLAGDHTPNMGFVNARRVWYSDVQQLDSPYHDPEYQGHGAIPVWFLIHSGIYQGEKLHGYEVFDTEDTVFTHVKLIIDGGYYIVETDDDIESVSTISGPYYEAADIHASRIDMTEPGSSFEQPQPSAETKGQNE